MTPWAAIKQAVTAENRRRGISAADAGAAGAVSLTFDAGCEINSSDTSGFSSAVANVQKADVAVLVFGIGTCVGPWGGVPSDCIEAEAFDRTELGLTGVQPQLLRALIATGTPLVLVLMSGSPLLISEWVLSPAVGSIVQHWYSGAEGGNGLVDLLFGSDSPSGRLPVTFPLDYSQLPADSDYSMQAGTGRTYRYSTVVPLYAFGYGLSYTRFLYGQAGEAPLLSPLLVSAASAVAANSSIVLSFSLKNVGAYPGDEVVQAYFSFTPKSPPSPVQSIPRTELKAFRRVRLDAGEQRTLSLSVPLAELRLVGPDGRLQLLPGSWLVFVGGSQPGSRGMAVDGKQQHALRTTVDVPRELSADCAAAQWWGEQDSKTQQTGSAVVSLPFSIYGGLAAVLTVC